MKKSLLAFAIICSSFIAKGQFLNGIGITVGASAAKQNFYLISPEEKLKKNYRLGINASVFAEFFSYKYSRWISEFQYNQKGSIDKDGDPNYKNKLSYVSWNNYLKIRYELFYFIPYVLVGPRLEYRLTQNTQSPPIVTNFSPIHVSAAVGAGLEFISYGNIKFLVEAFYNPDLIKYDFTTGYVTDPLNVQNINIELRVGLKYVFTKKTGCNIPTYVE